MKKNKIKYIFCENFRFEKGIWMGSFLFSIESDHKEYQGKLFCTYKQSTPSPSLQTRFSFPHSFSSFEKDEMEEIKKQILEGFQTIFTSLQELFITPRETHMPKPQIEEFQFHEEQSSEKEWIFSFRLQGHKASHFTFTMELEENTWYYDVTSNTGSLFDYKNTLQWEDYLLDEVILQIKKIPSIRYRFLFQRAHFKYRKKYR